MAEDTNNPQNRNNKTGQFGAGNKANPGGRPRMSEGERTMLGDAAPVAIRKLVEGLDAFQYVGMDGRPEPYWKERREYAIAILDRRYGKPTQSISGENGGPIEFSGVDLTQLSDAQFAALVALRDALKAGK